jgi:hypothetical protein
VPQAAKRRVSRRIGESVERMAKLRGREGDALLGAKAVDATVFALPHLQI